MQSIDRGILVFFNQSAQHWSWFDNAIIVLSDSDLVKGGMMLAIFWGMWFRRGTDGVQRERLLAGIGGTLLALSVSRVLACALPNRLRPVLDPTMHFVPPFGLPDQSNWTSWSSFPSDHAALFFALAFGIWLVSKRAGVFAFLYVFLVICLPRLYVGIHYPSDIVAGAALGIGAVSLLAERHLCPLWTRPLLHALERWPTFGYALFFLLSFQIATLFWDIRIVLSDLGFSV